METQESLDAIRRVTRWTLTGPELAEWIEKIQGECIENGLRRAARMLRRGATSAYKRMLKFQVGCSTRVYWSHVSNDRRDLACELDRHATALRRKREK